VIDAMIARRRKASRRRNVTAALDDEAVTESTLSSYLRPVLKGSNNRE
jgi:hypothetical protein